MAMESAGKSGIEICNNFIECVVSEVEKRHGGAGNLFDLMMVG
jgi:hypothetical protein